MSWTYRSIGLSGAIWYWVAYSVVTTFELTGQEGSGLSGIVFGVTLAATALLPSLFLAGLAIRGRSIFAVALVLLPLSILTGLALIEAVSGSPAVIVLPGALAMTVAGFGRFRRTADVAAGWPRWVVSLFLGAAVISLLTAFLAPALYAAVGFAPGGEHYPEDPGSVVEAVHRAVHSSGEGSTLIYWELHGRDSISEKRKREKALGVARLVKRYTRDTEDESVSIGVLRVYSQKITRNRSVGQLRATVEMEAHSNLRIIKQPFKAVFRLWEVNGRWKIIDVSTNRY